EQAVVLGFLKGDDVAADLHLFALESPDLGVKNGEINVVVEGVVPFLLKLDLAQQAPVDAVVAVGEGVEGGVDGGSLGSIFLLRFRNFANRSLDAGLAGGQQEQGEKRQKT